MGRGQNISDELKRFERLCLEIELWVVGQFDCGRITGLKRGSRWRAYSTSRSVRRRFMRSRARTTTSLSRTANSRCTVWVASRGPGAMYSPRMRLASSIAFKTVSSSGVFIVHTYNVRTQPGNELLSYSRFGRSKRPGFAATPGPRNIMDTIGVVVCALMDIWAILARTSCSFGY
jgi:hypothetical protein